MVLHNICIDGGDPLGPSTYQKRDREHFCDIMMIKLHSKTHDPLKNEITKVRHTIKEKLWSELESTSKDSIK